MYVYITWYNIILRCNLWHGLSDFIFYSQDYAIRYWIDKGAPKEKLNLGIGTYGRSFTLQNANNNGVGAPAKGAGEPGPYIGQGGYLGYNEVQQFLSYMVSSFYTQT